MKFLLVIAIIFSTFSASAKTLVYIGDSHSVGPYGLHLRAELEKIEDLKFGFYGSCGAVGKWFFTGHATKCGYHHRYFSGQIYRGTSKATPKFQPIVESRNPDYIIIQLGGNYRGYSEEFMRADVRRLLQVVIDSGAKCLWVGNPDSRKGRAAVPRLYRVLKEEVTDVCELFESNKVTKYPETGGDGIHYWGSWGTPIAHKWAELVLEKADQLFELR